MSIQAGLHRSQAPQQPGLDSPGSVRAAANGTKHVTDNALRPVTFSVKKDIINGTLVSLLPKYKALGNLGSHVYALHAPGRFIPPKVRSFIQFLRHEWEIDGQSPF